MRSEIIKTNYDVCVFGGGPSGSTIAKKLAQFGYSVLVVEKEKLPRSSIGLSLTSGIHHWLKILGIKDEIQNAEFNRAITTLVLWEDDQCVKKQFSPDKAGYHVDRALFDEILLQSSVDEGVQLLRPCTLRKLSQKESGNWRIELSSSTSIVKSISARFIVEATGRKSILKGTKKSYLPKMLATYAYWKPTSKQTNYNSIIEAGKEQWYWGAPVAGSEYLACIFSDPEEIKKTSSIKEFYCSKIASSTLCSYLLEKHKLGEISVCSATPYVDVSPVSQNYIKVGDAAFSMDPLSSQGVQKAIRSAYQGAIVVNTLLSQAKDSNMAIDYYSTMIKTEVVKNTKWTKQFYNKQNRFKEGKFWDLRKDHSIPVFDLVKDQTISIKKKDKLVLNHKARVEKIAIVGKDFIEYQKGILLEGQDEPFVFIQNAPLVPLVNQMNNKELREGLKIIHSYMPRSNPMEVLQWMVYNGILCLNNILIH